VLGHDELLEGATEAQGGVVVEKMGDGMSPPPKRLAHGSRFQAPLLRRQGSNVTQCTLLSASKTFGF